MHQYAQQRFELATAPKEPGLAQSFDYEAWKQSVTNDIVNGANAGQNMGPSKLEAASQASPYELYKGLKSNAYQTVNNQGTGYPNMNSFKVRGSDSNMIGQNYDANGYNGGY